MNPGKVALRISTKPGLPRTVLRPWKIGDISVFLNGYNNEPPTDSIRYKDMTIFYEGEVACPSEGAVRPAEIPPRRSLFAATAGKDPDRFSRLGIYPYIRKCNISPKIPPAVAIR